MSTVQEKAREWASGTAQSAEQAWETTRRTAQDLTTGAADTAEQAWDNLSTIARRYPIATFFCGMALGFLLAEATRLGAIASLGRQRH
jgi:hypothetical protein